MSSEYLADVYDGDIWKEFQQPSGNGFSFSKPRNYGAMLWFQPFKNGTVSVGVIYLVLINFPRQVGFKRENVILVGVIPALKSEPSSLNTFLKPLVDELRILWKDVSNITVSIFPIESSPCSTLCSM